MREGIMKRLEKLERTLTRLKPGVLAIQADAGGYEVGGAHYASQEEVMAAFPGTDSPTVFVQFVVAHNGRPA